MNEKINMSGNAIDSHDQCYTGWITGSIQQTKKTKNEVLIEKLVKSGRQQPTNEKVRAINVIHFFRSIFEQNRWIWWTNIAKSVTCLESNLNDFKGGIRQQTLFFSGPPSAAIFNILNPYSRSDYHQISVQIGLHCIFLSHCCIASTAKLRNWINKIIVLLTVQWCSNISDFMRGQQQLLNLHSSLIYRWYLTRIPFVNWKSVRNVALQIHYTRCIDLDTFRVRKSKL